MGAVVPVDQIAVHLAEELRDLHERAGASVVPQLGRRQIGLGVEGHRAAMSGGRYPVSFLVEPTHLGAWSQGMLSGRSGIVLGWGGGVRVRMTPGRATATPTPSIRRSSDCRHGSGGGNRTPHRGAA